MLEFPKLGFVALGFDFGLDLIVCVFSFHFSVFAPIRVVVPRFLLLLLVQTLWMIFCIRIFLVAIAGGWCGGKGGHR